ncbi:MULTISPECIES: glycosyltransferase [Pseudomonas]|uniref:Putative glycosyltransferase, family 2 n=1 Tax=Pseudomonas fluorescens (strain Pf0-1) TaxID=205922 RepID=Q3K8W2_PSEPF|nr:MULTISPECIES: glycosyltransferase [Pseudomonas]ABA75792.1 putative glycosyltransferase, family 2 [Pseudomonas fluorescens Pf0-1]MBL0793592.1 glycosyltransferase [Pseudomonas sp. B7]MBX8625634.1 glycosyltransferase [Pseudomonas glycinae]MBY9025372.1 glycosyltransferase [Pseudomonas fluorescens]MBY9031774.1 glycosyltransferase [Pseudomonas fluorescens]
MPVNPPKVAVLLAAYNGMQWIEEQLCSILSQTGVDVTIHISVDPSNDGTESWCASFAARHSNVVLLPPAGRFGGASRNFFRLMRDVELGAYDYVAFADQDDIWRLDKLERACRLLRQQSADAYSSNVSAFWPDGRTHLLDKAQAQVEWDYLFEAAGPGCTYVFTRSLAGAIKASMVANWQALQEVSLHDWYCYAFARSHRYSWVIDPESTLQYRQHERNQVGANTGLGSLVVRYKKIHNGWWFSQARLIALLVGKEQDPFVRGWQDLRRWQLLKLSLSACRCRRRGRDKLFFFFVCWLTALVGNKAE